jgi:hypothetical protein
VDLSSRPRTLAKERREDSVATNCNEMRALVQLICRTAIANKTAGYCVATCTTPQ